MVSIFLFFTFSMLGIYCTCNKRRKYSFLRHYFEFTSTKKRRRGKEETNKEERATLTQEDGSTRGRSEGLARHAGGLMSPYLAAGSHRALAALEAGHMFR